MLDGSGADLKQFVREEKKIVQVYFYITSSVYGLDQRTYSL